MMEHRGYIGSVTDVEDDGTLYGRVVNLRSDHVDFQGRTGEEIREAFRESIEIYLEICKERGQDPEKPFSGKFIVRVGTEVHRRLFLLSRAEGLSLNSLVVRAVERELEASTRAYPLRNS